MRIKRSAEFVHPVRWRNRDRREDRANGECMAGHLKKDARQYIGCGERKRDIFMTQSFLMKLEEIQPSQLYINSQKLKLVREWFTPASAEVYDPLPVKRLNGRVIFTDGHTRAYAAYRMGMQSVKVYWDEDELDWELYQACVDWCIEAGISSVKAFDTRIVSPEEYELLWIKRCENYQGKCK